MLRIILDREQQQDSWVRKSICVAVCGQTGNVASGTIGPSLSCCMHLQMGLPVFKAINSTVAMSSLRDFLYKGRSVL